MHGKGTYTHVDGSKYEGEFKDGNMHGEGISTYPDGSSRYKGEFKNSLKNGKGSLVYRSGAKYEGEFKDGELTEGVYINTEGDRYEGELKDLLPHGEGVLEFKGGGTYRGEFQNGMLHGKGILSYGGLIYRYEGEFRNNRKHGRGVLIEIDDEGKKVRKEGFWSNGKYIGRSIDPNGVFGFMEKLNRIKTYNENLPQWRKKAYLKDKQQEGKEEKE